MRLALLCALTVTLIGCDAKAPATQPMRVSADSLRICADPNNRPFSSNRDVAEGEGLEIELGRLLAHELGRPLAVHWRAQRRGVVREALNTGLCDVVPGIIASSELALTTRPYYRSTYVFLTRRQAARRLTAVQSFDDPTLQNAIIGVHVVGDDYTNPPPVHALANRGITRNVRGYSIFGDYAQDDPPLALARAVAGNEVDIAVLWGPFAGWAARTDSTLQWRAVSPAIDVPFLPFVYDIAVGVRRDEAALRDALDAALVTRQPAIDSLLARYGVPRA